MREQAEALARWLVQHGENICTPICVERDKDGFLRVTGYSPETLSPQSIGAWSSEEWLSICEHLLAGMLLFNARAK